jgi:nucleotide-binding universal stress UspA family protein
LTRVIAAITSDDAAEAVLSTAAAVSGLFGARVEALHVGAAQVTLSTAAKRAGVPFTTVAGETAQALADAVASDDVAALVIGARGGAGGKRPAGGTALAAITLQRRPVVLVPPDAPVTDRPIESVLVPLDGTQASAAALSEIVALAHRAALRIVVAHVQGPRSLPAFSDQLSHEVRAWSEEFIARQCPGAADATLELRVGEPHEHVLDILRESGCDLVALGWSQNLAAGRAAVVRRMLSESPVPVLLTPTTGAALGSSPVVAGAEREDARARS